MSKIEDCKIIELQKIEDERGCMAVIERQIPFDIKRIFYQYNTNRNKRGGHAHKNTKHFLIAINGSFDVIVDDGINNGKFFLNDPSKGLYVPELIWDMEINYSDGAVCLVIASNFYDENDYIRDYESFIEWSNLYNAMRNLH